jgi:hypothetical protein
VNDIDIKIIGLQDVADDHRRIAQKQLEIQENAETSCMYRWSGVQLLLVSGWVIAMVE